VVSAEPQVLSHGEAWVGLRARPATVNPHLFINWYTAVRTCPATHSWVSRTIGASAQAIREDRILHEDQAGNGDIRRLCDLFGLTPGGAERYARTTSEPTCATPGSPPAAHPGRDRFPGVGRAEQTISVTDTLLFCSGDLTSALEARQREARQAIADWDPDQLLATAEADVAEYLVSEYSVQCPVLHRERIEQLPVSEEVRPARGMFTGEQYQQRVTKIVIAVPCDGEEDVFKFSASTRTFNPPRGQVQPGELRLTWFGDQPSNPEPAAVRQHFDNELDKIEQFLGWARGDIDRHNANLRSLVSSSIAQRRAKLLADRQLEAGLGFAVRQRPDAALFAVPVTRRKLDISRPPAASGPFQPEPVLPQAQYEQALAVLRNARNALERSPSITARMGEGEIQLAFMPFALLDAHGPQ
jgi:hypothetical protein